MNGTSKAMSIGLFLVIVGLITTLLVQPIGVTATESYGENEDFSWGKSLSNFPDHCTLLSLPQG